MPELSPSLYETLLQNFEGDLELKHREEHEQYVLSVLDNLQRILNSRAGTLSHLPDFGLPDMGLILQGLPAAAHGLIQTMAATLLKYEPRLTSLDIQILPQTAPGHLSYSLQAQLRGNVAVTFATTLNPAGRALVRYLKQGRFQS